jgi:ATP-dependent Clp protease protease subunit
VQKGFQQMVTRVSYQFPGSIPAITTPPGQSGTNANSTSIPQNHSLVFSSLPSSALKAQFAGKIRFGHQLTRNDYVVTHGAGTFLNSDTAAKTLVALMQSSLFKLSQGDSSRLKYNLQAHGGYLGDMTATADNLLLLGRPVDTIIQSSAGMASTFALQTSRLAGVGGNVYISKDATLQLGPMKGIGYGTNHDWQISREHVNEYIQDLISILQLTTGENDRSKLFRDLNSAKELNSLQALAYGKNGLVDAILCGKDQVLSRAKLDEFYQSKGWNRKQIEEFNRHPDNMDEIPQEFLTPLSEFSKDSIVPEVQLTPIQRATYKQVSLPQQFLIFKRQLNSPWFNSVHPDKPHTKERISEAPDFTSQIQYWLGVPQPGIFYDDTILFHSAFTEFSADQVTQALHALNEKKQQQKEDGLTPSNIKILVNSPGGSIWAAEEIRSTLSQLETPVDVIAQGMSASAGAYLLASATGNRLATPHARIMIHQVSLVSPRPIRQNIQENNEEADNIQALTRKSARVIAKSSGRNEQEVWQDLKQDTWLNTLEAMFYGDKGLLDGILVASDKVVTREDVLNYLKTDPDVQDYLKKRFKKDDPEKNVKAYLDDRLKQLRDPNPVYDPKEWEERYGKDPFSNCIVTLNKLAAKAKPLSEIPKLQGSATRPQPTVDHFIVSLDDDRLGSLLPLLPSGESKQKAAT